MFLFYFKSTFYYHILSPIFLVRKVCINLCEGCSFLCFKTASQFKLKYQNHLNCSCLVFIRKNVVRACRVSPHRHWTGSALETALCSWWWTRQWSHGCRQTTPTQTGKHAHKCYNLYKLSYLCLYPRLLRCSWFHKSPLAA